MARRFFHRHQPSLPCHGWLKASLGSVLGMAIVGAIGHFSDTLFLIAPFAASSVLIFGAPESPLAQPTAVIGGHLLGAAAGLLLRVALPPEWWALGLAVGGAIFLMAVLRVTHPPAGAVAVVLFLSTAPYWLLLAAVLLGSLVLVLSATLFHRLPPSRPYPIPHPQER
ncbi:HPP family protein [Telmatospirillum sp. J64-1]|uniref:HPP family protein n=1 Tax=Telmatospirillum sp. J64-1 TaxID=2502183 RepID=UPI00115C6C08|nr:HPP family protein [Telmatospirillum sp. J64-1]